MLVEDTPLPGLKVVTPRRLEDARGWFQETWSRAAMAREALDLDWVQDNHSLSRAPGTVRGLHYQAPPHAQWKLVRCVAGAILDVAVDARLGSPTFGRAFALELSAGNGRQLLVPLGFLHGFATLTPDAEVLYKVSAPYHGGSDGAVRWDSVGLDWGVAEPLLSDKDRRAPPWADWATPFRWEGP